MHVETSNPFQKVTIDAASNDQIASEDLEILLEIRGLIRYASFRIRRACRMREQQSASPSANSSPSKISTRTTRFWGQEGGSLDRLRDSDLRSSTTTLDVYEDSRSSSRPTTIENHQMREDRMTENTAPTQTTGNQYGYPTKDRLAIGSPRDSKLGYTESSKEMNHSNGSPKHDQIAVQTVNFELSARQQRTRDATPRLERDSIEAMLNTMEEDVNTLLFQIFSFIYEILASIWSTVSHTTRWLASSIASLSGNRTFQAIALALLSLRLLQAFAVSTQGQVIATAVGG